MLKSDLITSMREAGVAPADLAVLTAGLPHEGSDRAMAEGLVTAMDNRGGYDLPASILRWVEAAVAPEPVAEASAPGIEPTDEPPAILYGSSVQPYAIDIGQGFDVQLGTVVAKAYADSGLSVEEWNELAEENRERDLAAVVAAMKAEIEQGVVVEGAMLRNPIDPDASLGTADDPTFPPPLDGQSEPEVETPVEETPEA